MAKKKIPSIVKTLQQVSSPEINFLKDKVVSFSQLNIFDCPLRWSLHYIEGIKPFSSNIYTVFGSALHTTIQRYLDVMYNKSIVKANELDLPEILYEEMEKEYLKEQKNNKGKHFSKPSTLYEFYEDGVKILDYFKKKRANFFSKRNWHLIGCEFPINIYPHPKYPNVLFVGYIDIVMYNENTKKFYLYDIKTSTKGWGKKEKKDENKVSQLVLYKVFFSKLYNIPLKDIEIEYLITKRKIWEESEWPIPRISRFSPPSGKIKQKRAMEKLLNFIEQGFAPDKGYSKENNFKPNPSNNCIWCPFYKIHLCSATYEEDPKSEFFS